MSFGENAIKLPPPPEFELTALDVEKGETVHPLDRLQIMSPVGAYAELPQLLRIH